MPEALAQTDARPSRRWPAPKAWKRTPARVEVRFDRRMPKRIRPAGGRARDGALLSRRPAAAPASCVSTSTRTRSAVRRKSSSS